MTAMQRVMLKVTYYFLLYRIDFVLLCLLVTAACCVIARRIRRKGPHFQLPGKSFIAAAVLVLAGGILAEWGARNQVEGLGRLFAGFGPTYAAEMRHHGHEFINESTPPDDPRYLEIIEMEKSWLSVNPVIADIYTFRKDRDGKIRLIVDSETDYNHNGKYDVEREQRTPIGELYEEATPKFFQALEGEAVFETTIMPDKWGIWVSSFTPIYTQDGRVEAAVGIDYPAESWLNAIASIRCVCLGIALVLVIILLTSSTFISFLTAEIEERKQAQQRLEQARESALDASAAKSEFLAVTSHEVRTPLTAILGFASILADTKLDPTQRRYLGTMNQAGERLMELLNGILDYTRIESGKLELEQLPWAPAMLIHEVIEAMSARATERGVGLQFDNQLPGNLTLKGDATRVRQILFNLLGNAIKFTAIGSVTVRARWTPSPEKPESGRFVLTVIDTGIGIPADKIASLFKAFAQVDASTTRTHGGSGLGLAISDRLATMMGGKVTVQSTLGQGSEFTLALDSTLVPAAAASTTVSGPGRPATAPVYSIRALVVDDQRLNRELLKVMLRRCGIESDLASSGAEAVKLAAAQSYGLVLTDLEMPEMDGFTTAQHIRAAEPPGQRVPIIAISALTAKGTRERCLAAGMDDYLTKPVYLPALHSSLAALLPASTAKPKPAAGILAGTP